MLLPKRLVVRLVAVGMLLWMSTTLDCLHAVADDATLAKRSLRKNGDDAGIGSSDQQRQEQHGRRTSMWFQKALRLDKRGRARQGAHRPKLQDRLRKNPALREKLKQVREENQARQSDTTTAIADMELQDPMTARDKMREFRNHPANKKAKEAMHTAEQQNTNMALGDPSTLVGLTTRFANKVSIEQWEDTPVMQEILKHMREGDLESFLVEMGNQQIFRDSGNDNDDSSLPEPSSETQRVFLDFNNGGNYTAIVNGVPFVLPTYTYTFEEQVEILERIRTDYAEFDLDITAEAEISSIESPSEEENFGRAASDGEFSTLRFNENIRPIELTVVNGRVTGFSIVFGVAENLDFFNTIRNDTALVNANFWDLLVVVDPSGKLLSEATGIPIENPDHVEEVLSAVVVGQSSNTGAHELGHILGLRHHDSFGAPGDGLPLFPPPLSESFAPVYTGQRNATESLLHTMASGASVGLTLRGGAVRDRFFSERSAIKMTLNEAKGEIISEEDAFGETLWLPPLEIPNTIVVGDNSDGKSIEANTLVITGRIDDFNEVDRYYLALEEGTFLTAEVISNQKFGFSNQTVISRLALFRATDDGAFVEITNNTQTFEPFDPLIVDAPITQTGTYVVVVSAPPEVYIQEGGIYGPPLELPENSTLLVGDYWLLLYNLDHEVEGSHQARDTDPAHTSKESVQKPSRTGNPGPTATLGSDRQQNDSTFREKMREFRNNPENQRAKEATTVGETGETSLMGDPSTIIGLAKDFSNNVDVDIMEDVPYLKHFMEQLESGKDLEAADEFRQGDSNFPLPSRTKQRVLLDFNNGGNYAAVVNGVPMELPAHVYTLEEQIVILERFRKDYEGFNLEIATEEGIVSPDSEEDRNAVGDEISIVRFNEPLTLAVNVTANGRITGLQVLFGIAEGIDFLNTNRNDTALVNANFWELIVVIDPTGQLLSMLTGMPIDNSDSLEKTLQQAVVGQSANTGSHELGHNIGLRHHDAIGALGALGDGIPPLFPFDGAFVPEYSGLQNATETLMHTMASSASLGLSLAGGAIQDRFFSERSAIKMTLNEAKGEIISEVEAKQSTIELPPLEIFNTILLGENAGTETIDTNTIVVTGLIENITDIDRYHVFLEEGTFLNVEVISISVSSTNPNPVVSTVSLSLEEDDGTLTEIANNSQTFEPFDPMLFDVEINQTGTYVVEVTAQEEIFLPGMFGIYDPNDPSPLPSNSTFLFGEYWLLMYNLDHSIDSRA